MNMIYKKQLTRVFEFGDLDRVPDTSTHTHTLSLYIYIHIYIYIVGLNLEVMCNVQDREGNRSREIVLAGHNTHTSNSDESI